MERIISFVDLDGVVYDPPEFLALMRLPIDNPDRPDVERAPTRRKPPKTDLRSRFTNEVVVLSALSSADGFMHPAEVSEIVDFVGRCAEIEGIDYVNDELDAVAQVAKRMKITESEAMSCLSEVKTSRKGMLWRTLSRVANADGNLDRAEFEFIEKRGRC